MTGYVRTDAAEIYAVPNTDKEPAGTLARGTLVTLFGAIQDARRGSQPGDLLFQVGPATWTRPRNVALFRAPDPLAALLALAVLALA